MRKNVLFLVMTLYFVLLVVGCSSIAKVKSNYDKCVDDPSCYAQMVRNRDFGSMVSTATATAVPSAAPYATLIGNSVGQLVFLLTGAYLGRKKSQ